MAKDDFKVKKGLVVGKGIVADSDVRANAFIGDGSQLTSLDYSNISGNLPNILDSGDVSKLIDSADTHDSAAVAGQIAATLNDTVTITKNSTTDPALILQTTADGSSAAPIMEFIRNTSQANNGDYLGQIKFRGEDSGGSATTDVYAKITGKIQDATDGTEDGLIEFAVKSGGSNLILARMTGNNDGKLLIENGTDIEVESPGNITVAGNTVLTTADTLHDSDLVHGQIDSALVNAGTLTGTIDSSHIPPLNTSDISSGIFDSARIPSLAAADIISGIFDSDLIPPLSAADITSGVFDSARIPALAAGGAGGISNVVEDNSPQLGGNLDLNNYNITGNGGITLSASSLPGAQLTLDGSSFNSQSPTTLTDFNGTLTVDAANAKFEVLTFLTQRSASQIDFYTNGGLNRIQWQGNDIWHDGNANANIDSHLNQSIATTGQVLSWNGTDYDWDSQIANVVEDTTPQLGGNLALSGFDIQGTGDITIDGIITATGEATIDGVNIGTGPGTGSNNTRVGDSALSSLTTGHSNTALGHRSGESTTTQTLNSYVGALAGLNAAGTENTAVGYAALRSGSSASNNSSNTAIGSKSLYGITTGDTNTAVGGVAGFSLTTGYSNTMVGYNAQASSATVNDEITLGDDTDKSFRIPGSSFYINGGSEGTTGTKVGVNTASPTAQLHVNGDIYTDSDLSANNITRRNTTVTAGTYGSTTGIPVVTVDGSGFVDSIGLANLSTILSTTAETGTGSVNLLDSSLEIAAGVGINTAASSNTVTVEIDSADLYAYFNHDSFSGFVADEHIAHSSININAGKGLTGGGNIASDVTIDIDSANVRAMFSGGDGLTYNNGTGEFTVVGGDGITANTDEIEVTVDGSTIELSATDGSGAVRVKDGGITNAKLQYDSSKIGTTSIVLGGSTTTLVGLTQIEVDQIDVDNIRIDGNTISSTAGSYMYIDPYPVDSAGTLVILGDLQVNGTTTTINSNNLSVKDKNIILADSATSSSQADGAGITVGAYTDNPKITYRTTGDKWEFNKDVAFADSDDLIMPDKSQIKLGNAADFLIYYDGTNSRIRNVGTDSGSIVIENYVNDASVFITTDDGAGNTTSYIQADGKTGEVKLNHYGAEKLATKSTGIDVTGEVLADSATISGNLTVGGNDVLTTNSDIDATNLTGTIDSARIPALASADITSGVFDSARIPSLAASDITSGVFDSDLIPQLRTDDVNEGTNVYYTDTRARGSVSGNKGLTYNSSTGVFDLDSANVRGFTIDSARTIGLIDSDYIRPLARAAIVAGTNITYDSDTGVISSSVGGHDSDLVQGQIDSNFRVGFTVGGNITFSDSDDLIMPDKSQIKLGNAADFLIYYDGINGRIRNVGDSGSIVIENYVNNESVFIKTDDGLGGITNYIKADGSTGEVQLYHYGSLRFNTDSTGVNITGEVVADSATINGDLTVNGNITANNLLDSELVSKLIDSADTHDSAAVAGQINATVTLSFINDLDASATNWDSDLIPALNTSDISSGIFDSARIPSLSTTDITSGIFDSARIPSLSTTDITSGIFDSARIPQLSTDDVNEGSNLYYTTARVDSAIDSAFAAGFTVGGNITFSDSDDLIMPDKSQILLGDDGDLQLYHDGGTDGNSRVRALNGKNLFIESLELDAKVIIKTSGIGGPLPENLKNYIIADGGNGQVQLYHYGVQKFNTTSTGVDVTGEVLADSATISGNITSNGNDVLTTASLSGNKGITYNSSTGVFDIDSANIQSFTIDSARTIGLIDSDYIRPLARAAIVAGSNITYDSATGIISSSVGGHDSDLVQGQIDSNFANDVTFGADITVGGIGIPNYVSLAQGAIGAGVTYYIDSGNTASLTTDSDKTITFTATGGNFTGLGGTAFTMLIKNNTSPDSDRVMTFVTSSGNTLHFNSANTLTVTGSKIGIVSGMVFGNNDIVLSSVGLDSSVTY